MTAIRRPDKGVPKRTFTDKMTLGSGSDRVDLFYFGRGHTGGDAWVVFPALRVLHAGDMFPNKAIPIMDKNARRADVVARLIGYALGGRAGERLTTRIGLPVMLGFTRL